MNLAKRSFDLNRSTENIGMSLILWALLLGNITVINTLLNLSSYSSLKNFAN